MDEKMIDRHYATIALNRALVIGYVERHNKRLDGLDRRLKTIEDDIFIIKEHLGLDDT